MAVTKQLYQDVGCFLFSADSGVGINPVYAFWSSSGKVCLTRLTRHAGRADLNCLPFFPFFLYSQKNNDLYAANLRFLLFISDDDLVASQSVRILIVSISLLRICGTKGCSVIHTRPEKIFLFKTLSEN